MKPIPFIPTALVMDFDGVHTDNTVLIMHGTENVSCSRADDNGFRKLKTTDIRMCVISGEDNAPGRQRCARLNVEYVSSGEDKLSAMEEWANKNNVNLDTAIYIGNDYLDVPCMKRVGYSCAPFDAEQPAINAADYVLLRNGGNGAIRELSEMILARIRCE